MAVVYYRSAGIPWKHIRRNWTVVFVFIGLLVIVNLFVSGGDVQGLPPTEHHLLFTLPILGTPITAESVSLAVTQFTRYLAMATIGFPVAFAIAPSDFGVAFRRLGVPEKFAFGIDLTFRFLPSLAADFQTTVDAQRIRGYDWSAGATGVLLAAPAVGARGGADGRQRDRRRRGHDRRDGPACVRDGQRSWLRELRYDRADRLSCSPSPRVGRVHEPLVLPGSPRSCTSSQFLIDLAGG